MGGGEVDLTVHFLRIIVGKQQLVISTSASLASENEERLGKLS